MTLRIYQEAHSVTLDRFRKLHLRYESGLGLPSVKNPWCGGHEIYNFGRPFLGHHYYMYIYTVYVLILSYLCAWWVESKRNTSNLHFYLELKLISQFLVSLSFTPFGKDWYTVFEIHTKNDTNNMSKNRRNWLFSESVIETLNNFTFSINRNYLNDLPVFEIWTFKDVIYVKIVKFYNIFAENW